MLVEEPSMVEGVRDSIGEESDSELELRDT
jgi:hypothetical protein